MSVGNSTIDAFRNHVARANDPIAAGVAAASVTASLAMSLLALTLEVTSRRKDFSGDRARLTGLLRAARRESTRLMRCADRDIAAYQNYRKSRKQKRGMRAAVRRIITTPLEAAAAATDGLELCVEASSLVPLSVRSDLGAAATLLEGGVRAILLTVEVNLSQLPASSELRREGTKRRRELERRASRLLSLVLGS